MERDLGPAVPFPPPLLFVGGIGLGLLLDRFSPTSLQWPEPAWVEVLGVLLVVLGLGVMFTAILTFRRVRTSVYPNRPAKVLVDTGVFARTRNPMYLGMTIAYCGLVLALSSPWALALLPAVHLLLRTQVIAREERHLQTRFPDAYADYCARVPRWV